MTRWQNDGTTLFQVVRRAAVLFAATAVLAGTTFLPPAVAVAASSHTASLAQRIPLGNGRWRATVRGRVGSRSWPSYYFYGKRGERLSLNFHQPRGAGLVLSWNITFPSGKTFGTKGYDPFNGRLTENGKYTIEVGANNMASNATSGSFILRLTLRPAARR